MQEALARALQTWPYYGVPKNPAAWLMQTAKNLALDVIRREKIFTGKEPQIIAFDGAMVGRRRDGEAPAFDGKSRTTACG